MGGGGRTIISSCWVSTVCDLATALEGGADWPEGGGDDVSPLRGEKGGTSEGEGPWRAGGRDGLAGCGLKGREGRGGRGRGGGGSARRGRLGARCRCARPLLPGRYLNSPPCDSCPPSAARVVGPSGRAARARAIARGRRRRLPSPRTPVRQPPGRPPTHSHPHTHTHTHTHPHTHTGARPFHDDGRYRRRTSSDTLGSPGGRRRSRLGCRAGLARKGGGEGRTGRREAVVLRPLPLPPPPPRPTSPRIITLTSGPPFRRAEG